MPPISRTESGAASPSNLDAYEPIGVIGSGTFGVIRKVKRVTDGKVFAQKELHFERMSDRDRKMIVSEVNILRTLTHQNIVRYEERFVDRENGILYIIMEYCQGGDLGSTIRECRKTKKLLTEEVVLSYLSQMIQGLDACHNAPTSPSRVILHRDLKPENIFLDGEQTVKIGDFGLSKEVAAHSFACTYVGTPYYMSPELAAGAHYDVKSDIWALGCVAYELCGLRPPFDATTQAELTRKIQLGHVPELPRGYSRTLGDMIRSMLCLDPSKRPTTRTLMQHPLIRLASRRRE
ncbi:kinase-like protein, partial [Meira miltonrushii]